MALLLIVGLCLHLSTAGASGACKAKLKNIAVYEGTLNTTIEFPAGENATRWTVTSTIDELNAREVINYDSRVDPSLAGDYAIGPSGLTILNATTTAAPGHPIPTVGLYTVQCVNSSASHSVKFLVVREGPICSRNRSSSSTVDLSCGVIYAESIYNPIPAVMTWFRDGIHYDTDTPTRTNYDPNVYIATSTITVDGNTPLIYECDLTFGKPTKMQSTDIATKAPVFNGNCLIWGSFTDN